MSEKRFLEESRTLSEAKFGRNGECGEFNYLNSIKISPIYQSIRMFEPEWLGHGAQDSSYFEPVLVHFSKLMKAYQALENEK